MTAAGLPDDAVAAVVTVSDRSHAGHRPDASGPLLADGLRHLGFRVGEVVVVPDEIDAVETALRRALAAGPDLLVTTGGTGLAARDVTPEAARRVIERDVPGIPEALRQCNRDRLPTTILSRAVAGVTASTLVVTLPGSTGAVRDGLAVLEPVVGHAVAQLRGGGDH
jgi:molybdenum cofactor biosynthesis protein B